MVLPKHPVVSMSRPSRCKSWANLAICRGTSTLIFIRTKNQQRVCCLHFSFGTSKNYDATYSSGKAHTCWEPCFLQVLLTQMLRCCFSARTARLLRAGKWTLFLGPTLPLRKAVLSVRRSTDCICNGMRLTRLSRIVLPA